MARLITFSKLLRRKAPANTPHREQTCENRKHRSDHHNITTTPLFMSSPSRAEPTGYKSSLSPS